MRLLLWLLPLSFSGFASATSVRDLGVAEDEAEPKLVREYRERLSSGSFRETTKVIAEMQKEG